MQLLARERLHSEQLSATRSLIDEALVEKPITEYKQLAHDVIQALGLDDTADELERVAGALKKRASKARRRCRAVTGGHHQDVVERSCEEQTGDMNSPMPPYRRRVVDEWYSPDGRPPDVEDINDQLDGDDELDDDDQDHDLGDPQGPSPR